MANTGFGLRLIGRVGGGQPRVREYHVPATDATALYVGDVVKLVATMDTLGEVNEVTRFATGNIPLGVIVDFKPSASLLYTGQYRAASTDRYILVCDDADAIYEVQEDAVSGVVSAANVAKMFNANLNVVAGSIYTGLSGSMLTSASVTASAADMKIIGVRRDGVNAAATATIGAVLLVKLMGDAIHATASFS